MVMERPLRVDWREGEKEGEDEGRDRSRRHEKCMRSHLSGSKDMPISAKSSSARWRVAPRMMQFSARVWYHVALRLCWIRLFSQLSPSSVVTASAYNGIVYDRAVFCYISDLSDQVSDCGSTAYFLLRHPNEVP